MVVIEDSNGGRFEVHAEGRHWETFNKASDALLVAQGLAKRVAAATGRAVTIRTPWGNRCVESPVAGGAPQSHQT